MTFANRVKQQFQYLVTDYGFLVTKVEESERAPETEGRIEFETPKTFVTVSSEQWVVGVSVGRVKDEKFEDFERLVQKEFMEAALKPFSPYIDHRREI